MKPNRVLLALGFVCLLLAAPSARTATLSVPAAAARGVYLNGRVYRVLRTGATLTMQIGAPQNPSSPLAGNFVLATDVPVNPVPSSYSLACQGSNHSYGGGIAVFNNRIYYAYTNQYNCYNNVGVYVATFDPYSAGGAAGSRTGISA